MYFLKHMFNLEKADNFMTYLIFSVSVETILLSVSVYLLNKIFLKYCCNLWTAVIFKTWKANTKAKMTVMVKICHVSFRPKMSLCDSWQISNYYKFSKTRVQLKPSQMCSVPLPLPHLPSPLSSRGLKI